MYHHAPAGRRSGRSARLVRLASRSRSTLLALAALILLALALPVTPSSAAPRPASLRWARRAGPAAPLSSAPLTLLPASLPSGRVGSLYLQPLLASGGAAPYSFAITFGELPAGLALSDSGVISGAPTIAGTSAVFILATDIRGDTVGQLYNLNIITPIAVSPPALPEGTAGSVYRLSFAASGGTAPYTFTLAAGALPPGLALGSGGLLSGTPSAPGFYSFDVDATDARGLAGRRSYGLLITPAFAIIPPALPAGQVGSGYSQALAGNGGTAPYTFTLASGSLPSGLALSSAGLLGGTPTVSGLFNFTIAATDARGLGSQQFYSLSIEQVSLAIGPGSLPNGRVGTAYRQTLTASGGIKPYSFALAQGALPPGLALGRDGRVSGTPAGEGFFSFTAAATDARGRTGQAFYTLLIAQNPLVITPASLPDGKVGTAYRQDLTVIGGTRPYTLTVLGSLPPGLALSSEGRLVGRPTTQGLYSFGIGVGDARGMLGGQFYSLRIGQAFVLNPPFFPNGMVGAPYQQAMSASGGKAPYTFALGDGALPPGLTLTPSGTISGRPTAPGSYGFTISASDSRDIVDTHSYVIMILTPVAVSPPLLLGGRVGQPYEQAFGASGGAAPYSFSVIHGVLPAGLALSATGVLSGTPAEAGIYSFTIGAADARGVVGSESYRLDIQQALDISPPFLGAGQVDQPFSVQLVASGGSAPYTFVITDGVLPEGLALSADGLLSGTSSVAGVSIVTVAATDARGLTGRMVYAVVLNQPVLSIGPDTLPNGRAGVEYRQQLTAAGGVEPYTFFSETLPPGFMLSADGLLHGTPTSPGASYFFGVVVVDASGNRANRSYDLFVPPMELSPVRLPSPVLGRPYSAALTASGGTAPYTFVLDSGRLPQGWSLSRGGTLSGPAPELGFYFANVVVVDANGVTLRQFYSFSPVLQLDAPPLNLPGAAVGAPYRANLSISGGTPPYSLSVASGALPPGLVVTESATIEGAPTISGVYTFTLGVSDSESQSASQTYTLVVN